LCNSLTYSHLLDFICYFADLSITSQPLELLVPPLLVPLLLV
jgi:hypothetical protein